MIEQKDILELHKPCCDNLNYLHKGYCLFCSKTKLTEYPCPTIKERVPSQVEI